MIIALFIFSIGLLPLVLALNVIKMYKGSELGIALLLFMISITLWQIDIGVLYLKDILSKDLILFIFRFFRIGSTLVVPLTFYIVYIILKKHSPNIKNSFLHHLLLLLFNPKIIWLLSIWGLIVYFINWTKWGIEGLTPVRIMNTDTQLYFPIYGELHFLYILHTGSMLFLLITVVVVSKGIQHNTLISFLRTFSFCALLLLITGFLNFIPGTGAVLSSIGVIIFTSIIIFSFVKLNNLMTINYNLLSERQKKLDFLGDVSASLVHEVKNNLQIIKAYSQMLPESTPLPKDSEHMVKMIQLATKQLEDLTFNYTDYLNKKSINFKNVDLNEIISESMTIVNEIINERRVGINFEKKYKPLIVYANSTYLKQVFINLIKNSCEAITDENESRKIDISTDIVGEKIIIDISDSGHGIPVAQWESIFDPFISSKEIGMGIGLPFVRKIIFEHRGEIFVLSSSREGTTFRMLLPQYEFSK
ncbi:sensor histidine kinase [Litchfieldia salsa]|uniref:histidine kinase n=1 Tax=Litchfieldia salsa TaxID=930152 RepID=A0A1H0VZ36_9BACI|nr:ATP-binding protein [Litchfieldia salsa]SDP83621.1 Histidine kinase-, DNA gyrase B-, and HSP90-like ATPase [Litchfieldia salsa]